MIRRLPLIALLLVAVAGVAFLATRGGDEESQGIEYRVVMDNAFGLTTGADLRVAGVRVGSVDDLDVERETARAVAIVKVEKAAFGRLHKDVRCTVQPQSLIGEYFLDCEPGDDPQLLEDGATIPASQTFGTVPPDLVQGIMRRPYNERLSLILSEFGAGLGARGEELNTSIQKAIPALQQTDRVLKVLAEEKRALQALVNDSSVVVSDLADRRDEVAGFVREARDTAAASAERDDDLRATVRGLPTVLRELRPTLRDLGTAAEEQTPALRDLRLSAGPLTQLARDLGPFTEAAGPAVEALGEASATGRGAVRAARSTVQTLRQVAAKGVEPLTNARFVLEHLDDRDNAVEPNKLAPDPAKGFTGLEAFLTYFFVQAQGINIYDERGHFLKLNLSLTPCSRYHSAVTAKNNPERRRTCGGALGPSAPGIDSDLNTRGAPGAMPATTRAKTAKKDDAPAAASPSTPTPAAPAAPSAPSTPAPAVPSAPAPSNPVGQVQDTVLGLLDYLLKP